MEPSEVTAVTFWAPVPDKGAKEAAEGGTSRPSPMDIRNANRSSSSSLGRAASNSLVRMADSNCASGSSVSSIADNCNAS